MKKNTILWMAASAVVMLAFPWLAVTFVKGDAGMAVCFLLFFAVNPVYSAIIGTFAGKDIRRLWSLPVISAMLFLIGKECFNAGTADGISGVHGRSPGIRSLETDLHLFYRNGFEGGRIEWSDLERY